MKSLHNTDQTIKMNVKSVAGVPTPIENVNSLKSEEKVKTFESTDRDADGKQESPDHDDERELSKEEQEQLLEKMRQMGSVKKNNLKVELLEQGSRVFLVVKDPQGQVIKRMTPYQAWKSIGTASDDQPKGQLLDKAM